MKTSYFILEGSRFLSFYPFIIAHLLIDATNNIHCLGVEYKESLFLTHLYD